MCLNHLFTHYTSPGSSLLGLAYLATACKVDVTKIPSQPVVNAGFVTSLAKAEVSYYGVARTAMHEVSGLANKSAH